MRTIINTPWLGTERGYFSDWITQRWVQLTGRNVDLDQEEWLVGPIGKATGIGEYFFEEHADEEGLIIQRNQKGSGLVKSFNELTNPNFDASLVNPQVIDFYENTSAYDLDIWGEWNPFFRPFGNLLALLFSRRLQQLNVPLSPLEPSQGVTSEVLKLVEPQTGKIVCTAWVRKLIGTSNVLYAGSYSLVRIPNYEGLCVRVVFPLPNGNAIVVMKPENHTDGSFSVVSAGREFGDPGFYFVVYDQGGRVWARYVKSLKERIHVFVDEKQILRGNHTLTLFGLSFLRLHYRLTNIREV